MKILAGVVTYNRVDLLKECIESLKGQTFSSFDILVVDNASTDATSSYLSSLDGIIVRRLEKNLGGAGGFNFIARYAVDNRYDYIWLMDDDTIPDPTALEELVKAKNELKNDFSFLSSYVKWTDGSGCEMNLNLISYDYRLEPLALLRKGFLALSGASFVSFFTKVELIRKVGLPIKDFFIWGDDYEFSLRLLKKNMGYLILDSTVVHKMKDNHAPNIKTDLESRVPRYFYYFRNNIYISRKHKGFKTTLAFTLEGIGIAFGLFFRGKFRRAHVAFKGILHGLFFNPKIEMPVQDKDSP